jgi:4-amino-4-deoxy-L-arabinose transferase-like glycosyltransferase
MTAQRVTAASRIPSQASGRDQARRERRTEALAWCVALSVVVIALVAVDFASQDPDSALYAAISARLAGLPVQAWIAPEWWGLWNGYGPYREHPVGVLLLPAMLGKLGFPPLQSAFAIGALFSLLALVMLRRVASLIVGEQGALVASWVALILPVAFVNRVRATQEYPVLFLILAAVYATEKSRVSQSWIFVAVAATCATALVKGVFVVFVPIVCGAWLLCFGDDRRDTRAAWLGIAFGMAALVICAFAYEWLYRRATGDSFFDFYLSYRLNQLTGTDATSLSRAWRTGNNLLWYMVRLLWFGFPGTLALLVAAATSRRGSWRIVTPREARGLYFALCVAAAYVAVMSLGATRAERYILPADFAVGVAGALVAVRRWAWCARVAARLPTLRPYALPFAWMVLILAALPFELYVPYVRFRP